MKTPAARSEAGARSGALQPESAPLLSGVRARMLVLALNGWVVLLLALYLWVRRLPATPTPIPGPADAESAWWGLWPAITVPAAWVVTTTLLIAGAVAWALVWEIRHGHLEQTEDATLSAPRWLLPLLGGISLALVVAFFAFPLVHTRWGDAYLISRALAWPDAALRLTHSWQAPLDLYLHGALWRWVGPARGWETAEPVYRLLSPMAGALYLAAALGLAAVRYRERLLGAPWLTWGLFASLGLMQLFFGYVENYSFAAALILIYFWLAMRALDGRTPVWQASMALAITHAFHPSTIMLAPSLLVLGFVLWRSSASPGNIRPAHIVYTRGAAGAEGTAGARSGWRLALEIALPMVLVGSATLLWMEASGHGLRLLFESDRPGGGDGRWLVPLRETTTRWEHYTLFSWLHLRDWLNLQLLVAPAVGPALLAALLLGWGRLRSRTLPALAVVGSAALCALLFSWLWNADYGGQRDWDLFSLTLLPATLLCAVMLAHLLRGRRLLAAAGPLLLIQALHTAAWIHSNTLPWAWPA
jgi:hypothetical protein